MSSLTIHAHIGADRGEISAMTRKPNEKKEEEKEKNRGGRGPATVAGNINHHKHYMLSLLKGKSDMSNFLNDFLSLVEIMSRLRGVGGGGFGWGPNPRPPPPH